MILKKFFFLVSIIVVLIMTGCTGIKTFSPNLTSQSMYENKMKLPLKKTIPANFIPRELNIVAVGDSLTEGVGDSTKNGGYLAYLEELLNQEKSIKTVNISNFGKKGDKTVDLIKKLNKDTTKTEIKKANFVIITIGGNDLTKVFRDNIFNLSYPLFKNPQQKFTERINEIVSLIRNENESAYIILVGLYNPFYQWFQSIEELKLILDDWNDGSEMVLQKYDFTLFVKIDDIFENNESNLMYKDNFHPNDLGYEEIANRIYREINVDEIFKQQSKKLAVNNGMN